MTRGRGSLQLVGVSPPGSTLPSDLFALHQKEITIRGAYARGKAFGRALARLTKLGIEKAITSRYALEDIANALGAASHVKGVKTVITL